jgi:hypothetical protein
MSELLFVYNADSTVLAQIKDLLIKLFAPNKYACNLCMLTYGVVRMKKTWRVFIEGLPYNVRFLHRDEFRDRYGDDSGLPAAFTVENGKPMPFLTARQINGVHSLDGLIGLLKRKLADEE